MEVIYSDKIRSANDPLLKFKFHGILSGYKVEEVTLDLIKLLHEKMVLVPRKGVSKADIFKGLEGDISFKEIECSNLEFNEDFVAELYIIIKYHVEEIFSNLYIELMNIETKLDNPYFLTRIKLDFLKSEYFNLINSRVSHFEAYTGLGYGGNPRNWFELTKIILFQIPQVVFSYLLPTYESLSEIEFDSTQSVNILRLYDVFISHLNENGERDDLEYYNEFINDWVKCFEKASLLDFFKTEIEAIYLEEGKETNTEEENLQEGNTDELNFRFSKLEVAYIAYYSSETNELKLSVPFPSEKGYQELSSIYGPNWKNIQQDFNSISMDRNLRLLATRKKKIQNILPVLGVNARKLAEKELLEI